MNAVLYVEATDGTVELFKSTPDGWRAALNASGNWQAPEFNDSSWKAAHSVCSAELRVRNPQNWGIRGRQEP